MAISYDEAKRAITLRERGLDFADVAALFEGYHLSAVDARRDYGEARIVSIGRMPGEIVVVVWTWRGPTRRIISLRRAGRKEREAYEQMERSR